MVDERYQLHDPVAVGESQCPAVGTRLGDVVLDAGHRRRDEMREHALDVERLAEREAQIDPTRDRRCAAIAPAGAGAQVARRRREDLLHGGVELADARETRGPRDRCEIEAGGLDEEARGLRALRPGQRQRPCADLGPELALELAHAVPEPARQPGDPFTVDHAVGDAAHGAGHEIGARVPFRRAGAGVGTAPFAGAEAGFLRGCGSGKEPYVLGLGQHRGAARPAVDAGGGDRGDEPPVEAGVLALEGPVAAVEVVDHP